MNPNKNIVVYCSSKADLAPVFEDAAARLGRWIGTHSHTLVYGGVNAGLMHTVAENTRKSGGRVLGVCPEVFSHRADPICHDLLFCRDLNDRKGKMIELGDIFVVLPGGIGTIDEWISTISDMKVRQARNVGYHRPVVVLNINGMYNPLIEQLHQTASTGFGGGAVIKNSVIAATTEQMIDIMDNLLPE